MGGVPIDRAWPKRLGLFSCHPGEIAEKLVKMPGLPERICRKVTGQTTRPASLFFPNKTNDFIDKTYIICYNDVYISVRRIQYGKSRS